MTVAGNLAFQSGALYLVQVNPSNASSANVDRGRQRRARRHRAGGVRRRAATSRARTRSSRRRAGSAAPLQRLTTTNLPAGFTASLSYTASDVILNLTAILGGPSALGTGGLSTNQRNVANSLNTFFNNGGALPPGFVNDLRPHRRQSRQCA